MPTARVPVLMVDDHPPNLLALEAILDDPGYELVRALSGPEALDRLAGRDFAVVLLDLSMPGLDGFETARIVRRSERSRDTPIIFLTARDPSEFPVAEAYRLGAVDYLTKPLIPDILRAKVAVFADLFRKAERVRELERQRGEAARRAAEEQLRLMVESATDYAIFSIDTDGLVTSWNAGAERVFGYAEAEIIGTSADVVFTAEDRAAGVPRRERETALAAGRAADERWHIRKDGTRFFSSGVLTPIRNGGLQGFTKVARDVTERKLAADALARDALLLANVRDSVIVTDLAGVVTYWNEGAARLFGWTAGEMLGRPLTDRFPPEARPRVAEMTRAIAAGREWVGEFEDYRKDGSRVWIDARVRRYDGPDGRPLGVIGLAHDVTDRKRLEAELRLRVEELAERDRRKDEFLALLGHELRNPLAPVRNALHIMALSGGDLPPAVAQARQMMGRQVDHLVRLVDDLLDVSRVIRGKVELRRERIDLASAVRAGLETAGPAIEAAGHRLSVSLPSEPLWVDADPTRLAQVFGNLLNNAAKYTPPGGRVEVTAGREGDRAEVRVRDNGVGIDRESLGRVFDLFAQVDQSAARSQGGLGIGLTLVKRLVEMHGGTVEAHSEGLARGSEFVVRLPPADAPGAAGAAAGPVTARAGAAGRRVLVIEDNADVAESLRVLLVLAGHEVEVAASGSAGVEAAGRFRPAVVLCDLGLPGMDGYAVARALRADPATAGVRLVSVSGYGQEEDRRKAREAGFDETLVKPVDPAELVRAVGRPGA